jgi:16S rRNA (guanine527-N7)-methyltransferase
MEQGWGAKPFPFHVKSTLSTAASLSVADAAVAAHLATVAPITPIEAAALGAWTRELDRWQRVQRLVGWTRAEDVLRRGLGDAWALAAFLRAHADPALPIVDVGSGNGLPGLVLAAAWPERAVHLVERIRKRCAFLREAARAMGLPRVTVHHEDAARVDLPRPSLLVARAVEAPAALLDLAARLGAAEVAVLLAGDPPRTPAWTLAATGPSPLRGQGFALLAYASEAATN